MIAELLKLQYGSFTKFTVLPEAPKSTRLSGTKGWLGMEPPLSPSTSAIVFGSSTNDASYCYPSSSKFPGSCVTNGWGGVGPPLVLPHMQLFLGFLPRMSPIVMFLHLSLQDKVGLKGGEGRGPIGTSPSASSKHLYVEEVRNLFVENANNTQNVSTLEQTEVDCDTVKSAVA